MDFTRLASIDDTDSRFIYHGSWIAKQTSESWGASGVPFRETLHETVSGGAVIFLFKNASKLSLFGNIDTLNRPKPSWNCALDGNFSERREPPTSRRGFYSYCTINVPDGGEHQLTLNVTVPLGGIFEIDGINVTPVESLLEGETLQVQDADVAVTYSPESSWVVASNVETHATDTPGSSLQFNFTGSAVQFVGVYQPNKTQSSGEYTIDDSPAKSFTIPGPNDATLFNRVLISETGLSTANHSLNVAFTGKSGQTPLTLGYFYITLPPGKSLLESSAIVTDFLNEPKPSKSSKPTGAIVGGTIGGVAGFIIIVISVFFIWRRYRSLQRKSTSDSEATGVTPFVEDKRQDSTPSLTPPVLHIKPPPSSAPNEPRADGKRGPTPLILAYDPFHAHMDVLHEDSGFRAEDAGTSGSAWPVEVRDIPPVYSPV